MYDVDFSRLSCIQKAAIIIQNKEQLATIERKMRADHPALMDLWRPGELSDFELLEDDEFDWDGPVCVAPHIYDSLSTCLQVSDAKYWEERGYTLIDFGMLVEEPKDFGEIEAVETDVLTLLG